MKTKTIVLFFVLHLFVLQLYAQKLIKEGKVWSQVNYELPSFTAITEHLKIEGDTLIDSLAYKKVFRSTNAEQTDWKKYLSIRETINGSIYFRTDTSKQEYLFFNPNCNISDTLNLYTITSGYNERTIRPFNLRIEGKDSIMLNGQFVKRISLCNISVPDMTSDYYLEGIGSTAGLLYWDGMLVGGDNYNLICCNENGTLIFHDKEFPTCYYSWDYNSIEELNSTSLIEVVPLGEDIFRVKMMGASKGKICIYNLSGKQIHGQVITQPETSFCLPESGILIYRFTTTKGEVQTEKVVVR